MSHTLAELRRELARSLASYVSGYVSSSDTNYLIDSTVLLSGQWSDDHFVGADLYIVAADNEAPQGENRYVTAFDSATGKISWAVPFSAALEVGDQYELYLNSTVAELNNALMFAVKDWRFLSSDEVVTTAAEYTIDSAGLSSAGQVTGIFIRHSDRPEYGYYPISAYRCWDQAGTVHLEILDRNLLNTEYYFRIEYLAEYKNLKDTTGEFLDSATVGGDLNLHMLRAKRAYYDRRMNAGAPDDRDWYASLMRFTVEELDKVIETPRRRASRAKLQNWGDGAPFDI